MKLSDIKKEYFLLLEDKMKEFGFKPNKKDFAFKKETKDVLFQISIIYNFGVECVELLPFMEIKRKDIHKICELNNYELNYTAFINLFLYQEILKGNFNDETEWTMGYNETDRFKVYNSTDMKVFCHFLSDFMTNVMFFFEKYSTLNGIDSLFNTDPEFKFNPYCSGMDTHCIIGLISAKLCNHNYEEIKEVYKNELHINSKHHAERTLKCFGNLIKYFEENPTPLHSQA